MFLTLGINANNFVSRFNVIICTTSQKVLSDPCHVLRNISSDETVPFCGLRRRRYERENLYIKPLSCSVYSVHILTLNLYISYVIRP